MQFTWHSHKIIRITIEYWLLLFMLAGGLVYYEGSTYRDTCRQVPGVVVDQVGQTAYKVGASPFKPRPLFRYIVDGEVIEAVPPYVDMPIGSKATLLIDPDNNRDIRVYNASYWIVYGFNTFPIFLFGGLIYAVLRVLAFRLVGQLRRLETLRERLNA
jgi:hypothetical protein